VSAAWMPRPSPHGRVYGVPRDAHPPGQTHEFARRPTTRGSADGRRPRAARSPPDSRNHALAHGLTTQLMTTLSLPGAGLSPRPPRYLRPPPPSPSRATPGPASRAAPSGPARPLIGDLPMYDPIVRSAERATRSCRPRPRSTGPAIPCRKEASSIGRTRTSGTRRRTIRPVRPTTPISVPAMAVAATSRPWSA
jgi:hypothetical protein